MRNSTCSRCGSDKIAHGVRFIDRTDYKPQNATLEIRENPRSWLFADTEHFDMIADVCGACGAVELRTKSPAALWESYERQQRNLDAK